MAAGELGAEPMNLDMPSVIELGHLFAYSEHQCRFFTQRVVQDT